VTIARVSALRTSLDRRPPVRTSVVHSVDTAVRLPDGRALAFRLYGRVGGRPLYVFHGFPGSRHQAALLEDAALAAGVCLVGIDRPGFGGSTHAPDRTILGWPDDVARLADALGHRRFGVLGISCGGPYALACAYRMGARLDYVGLLAGMGPMDVPWIKRAQLPILRVMFALARVSPLAASPLLALDWLMFRTNPGRAVDALASMLTGPDRRLLTADAGTRARFAVSLAEAYRQGLAGPTREAHLIASPRGFALEAITMPVHIYQSGADRHVPPMMGRYLAARLPQSRLRFYADEGHLSIVVNRAAECLRDFCAAGAQ
jgi:pimeloyl-ACP methyl ester carboxylesterase